MDSLLEIGDTGHSLASLPTRRSLDAFSVALCAELAGTGVVKVFTPSLHSAAGHAGVATARFSLTGLMCSIRRVAEVGVVNCIVQVVLIHCLSVNSSGGRCQGSVEYR